MIRLIDKALTMFGIVTTLFGCYAVYAEMIGRVSSSSGFSLFLTLGTFLVTLRFGLSGWGAAK